MLYRLRSMGWNINNRIQMDSSIQPIFHQISHQELSSFYYDNTLTPLHNFTRGLSIESTENVWLSMNNTHIYIFDNYNTKVPKLITPFDFSLKFQIIRQEWKDQYTPGKPIGITFEKDHSQNISLYCNSPAILQIWRTKLETKINQRGFHKLFRAKRKIGKGAFATVYLAQRLIDKKLVAVKAFSKQRQYSGDKGKDSLINQITIMRKVRNHPNITNLEGVFETQNSIYVILQNLDGGQLHEKIKMGVRFNLYDTTQIMSSILKGLAYMDSHRIIHRDLKPQNLLFRTKNSLEIVIADYGLATLAEEPNYLFVRCGTPGFVAPQIINIKDMSTHSDPISDVFSAGLIFHFLLLGRSVFKGVKYAEILAQNRACDFQLVGPQYDELDRNAYQLLCKMLQVNPKLRIRAHQALNHNLFRQSMQIEGGEVEMKFVECLSFTKQTKINSIYESQIPIKGKQNLSIHTTPKKLSEFKKKRQSININQSILSNKINNENYNA